jgi:hypothetical protein
LTSTRVQKRNDPKLKRWWKPHTLPWLCSVHGGGLCGAKHPQPGFQPDGIPRLPCRFRRRFSLADEDLAELEEALQEDPNPEHLETGKGRLGRWARESGKKIAGAGFDAGIQIAVAAAKGYMGVP